MGYDKKILMAILMMMLITLAGCSSNSADLEEEDGDKDVTTDGDLDDVESDSPLIEEENIVDTNVINGLCDGIYCSGLGRCVVIDMMPACICNDGYHAEQYSCVENSEDDPCEGVDCGEGSCELDPENTLRIYCSCPEGTFSLGTFCVTNEVEEGCVPFDRGDGEEVCLTPGDPNGDMQFLMYPDYGDNELDSSSLPDKVDHRADYLAEYLTKADDQGYCGTCVAFATVHSLEAFQAANFTNNTEVSQSHAWQMAGLDLNCTDGTSLYRVASAVTGNDFVVGEDTWKYQCTYSGGSCAGYLSGPQGDASQDNGVIRGVSPYSVYSRNTLSLESALSQGYNVIYGVPVYDGWSAWNREVVIDNPTNTSSYRGGHAILITGYDRATQRFQFLNSWSESWGDQGYGYFTYRFIASYGYGGIAIRDYVAATCEVDTDCSCGFCVDTACVSGQEVYNSRDDNCDGRVDEGMECESGASRTCGGVDVGECQSGSQTCVNNVWQDCVGDIVGPEVEICDNKDNDCDGQTDENVYRNCGIDVGECQIGKEYCEAGEWGSCVNEIAPVDEVCDNKDNDCDGSTDEDLDEYDAPLEKRCPNVGVCSSGGSDTVCEGGAWKCNFLSAFMEVECPAVSEQCGIGSFEDESCFDGLDNDCDGVEDENNGTIMCQSLDDYENLGADCYHGEFGVCLSDPGTYACSVDDSTCAVFLKCIGGHQPILEKCDGLDWDCNGRAYDRYDIDNDGFGNCPGYEDCDETSANAHPGGVEICDFLDNDCNGLTDELDECQTVDGDQIDGDSVDGDEIDGDLADGDEEYAEQEDVVVDIDWKPIPAGNYYMGCSPNDNECYSGGTEEPRHLVEVDAFEMMATEVTQNQYKKWEVSYEESCPNCPVEKMTWYKAKAFCEAIGGRLPNEAEWEYAARAGTTSKYYCGNDMGCLSTIAWSTGPTHEVAQKIANAWGLYDMLGNVWEWVEDCPHPNYDNAPDTAIVWEEGDCSKRVFRGGCWGCTTMTLRASARKSAAPDLEYDYGVGFRCARAAQEVDGDDPVVDGDDPVVDGDDPVVDGDDPVVDGDDPVVDGDDPVVDGDDPVVDGDDPVVDGDDPVVDGDDPVVDGDDPVVDGDDPVVDGDDPVVDGDDPVVDGDDPVIDGDDLAVDGDDPVVDGDDPVVDGDDPVVDGDDPVVDGDDPVVDGDDPVVDGDDPVVDGDDPVVDGDDPVVDGDDPVVDGDDPVVDGDDPVVDGDDPVVDGDDPVVDGDDPVVDGDDPVVDGDDPVVDGDLDEELEPEEEIVPPPVFSYVCAGSFDMGCSPGDDECTSSETNTSHEVMTEFSVSQYETTQAQFEDIMGFNPSFVADCPDCAVDTVTWYEAKQYCEAIGARLPTQAEWEYAARATTSTKYYCGNDASCLTDIAWYLGNLYSGEDSRRINPVGMKNPNLWGIYDMLGNVREWVSDCSYSVENDEDCDIRIQRGGGWYDDASLLRVTARTSLNPTQKDYITGFRCVKDL